MAVPTALAEQMKTPEPDLDDRRAIGDAMQMFWMDTDPAYELDFIAKVCSQSSYSLGELEAIFWNEVRSAVSFNLFCLPAPEWAGIEIGWLTERILRKHRFGGRLPNESILQSILMNMQRTGFPARCAYI